MAKRITTPAPETITISLRLPGAKTHPNARSRTWKPKARETAADRALAHTLALVAMEGRTFGWRAATERVVFRVKGRNDPSNLSAWLKAYRDGFVDAGILTNDDRVTHLPIEQIVDRKAPTGVSITLTRDEVRS